MSEDAARGAVALRMDQTKPNQAVRLTSRLMHDRGQTHRENSQLTTPKLGDP
jgi:hypothetical protein